MEVPFRETESFTSRDQLLTAASELMGSKLPQAMEREVNADDPLPGIDSIESWGARAVELVGHPKETGTGLALKPVGRTEQGNDVQGLIWIDLGQEESLAFHSPEALVVDLSGVRELEISQRDDLPADGMFPFSLSRSFFEWRCYLGGGTLVSEGEGELKPDRYGRLKTFRMKLLGSAGALVGRGLRWMGRSSKPTSDPFMPARLRHFEERHPAVAKRYPDLGAYLTDPRLFHEIHGAPGDGPALVFVHGTFSCAVPTMAVLGPLALPAWRFEHDTFRSIADNAARLTACARHLSGRPLHLVAHSRGGLVARLSARQLTAAGHQVTVRTYGTPHKGTPLANAGGRMLNALLAMGRTVVGGAFTWDPASLAGKLAFKALTWSKLPDGLEVMRTDSQTLAVLNLGEDRFPLISYGGEYDLRRLADGACAYALGEALSGGFGGEANDLVVPTVSALGAGDERPSLGCDHFQYFSTAVVRDELRGLA